MAYVMMTEEDIKNGVNPFRKWVHNRIYRENGSVVMLISGNVGSGKTRSGIREAVDLDKTFKTDFIIQSTKEALELMKSATEEGGMDLKGKVILYEEPQQEQYNKRSQTHEAVGMVQLLSTCRSLNTILIMTTPRSGQLTKDLLSYVDVWAITEFIDRKQRFVRLRTYVMDWHDQKGQNRIRFLRVGLKAKWGDEPYTFNMKYMDMGMPPKELYEYYDTRKLEYQNVQYSKLIEKMMRKQKEKKEKFPQTCPKCKHEWEARTKSPRQCPKCHKYLRWD